MGASDSKPPTDPVLYRIEQEAVRGSVPRGLSDDLSRKLEYELNWCYTKNNWYFTGGGLLVALGAGYFTRSIKPIAYTAILAPFLDFLYERHACADIQEAYSEHKKKIIQESRARAEQARQDVRQHYSEMEHKGK